eukprot:3073147-Prymnesium_polylepis.1
MPAGSGARSRPSRWTGGGARAPGAAGHVVCDGDGSGYGLGAHPFVGVCVDAGDRARQLQAHVEGEEGIGLREGRGR